MARHRDRPIAAFIDGASTRLEAHHSSLATPL
jgi:hypothetical protein